MENNRLDIFKHIEKDLANKFYARVEEKYLSDFNIEYMDSNIRDYQDTIKIGKYKFRIAYNLDDNTLTIDKKSYAILDHCTIEQALLYIDTFIYDGGTKYGLNGEFYDCCYDLFATIIPKIVELIKTSSIDFVQGAIVEEDLLKQLKELDILDTKNISLKEYDENIFNVLRGEGILYKTDLEYGTIFYTQNWEDEVVILNSMLYCKEFVECKNFKKRKVKGLINFINREYPKVKHIGDKDNVAHLIANKYWKGLDSFTKKTIYKMGVIRYIKYKLFGKTNGRR